MADGQQKMQWVIPVLEKISMERTHVSPICAQNNNPTGSKRQTGPEGQACAAAGS